MTDEQIRPEEDEVEAHKRPVSPQKHFLNEPDDEEVEAHKWKTVASPEDPGMRIG